MRICFFRGSKERAHHSDRLGLGVAQRQRDIVVLDQHHRLRDTVFRQRLRLLIGEDEVDEVRMMR